MKNDFLIIICSVLIIVILAVFMPKSASLLSQVSEEEIYSCEVTDLSGELSIGESLAYFEGQNLEVPATLPRNEIAVLGTNDGDKWIEVDLSDQKLKAWENGNLFLETPVSTGLPGTPTPTGEFRIWIKLRATRMQGGMGRYYYNLPNVPYVMYFSNSQVPGYKGYGLHGAYWHNNFGTRRSHGCVNLPIPEAEKLYYWATPNIPEGKNTVKSTGENPGTRILIHE